MRSSSTLVAATFVALAQALDGIVAPSTVVADQAFNVTFDTTSTDTSDQFRVFLAAASVGQNGPFCYLMNSTTVNSPLLLTIPAAVGPDGSDYSIAMADVTLGEGATYGNKFNFTGGTGVPTEYETHLAGKPFWDGNELPCSAVPCARLCAMEYYPSDLTNDTSYAEMVSCIQECPGVTTNTSENTKAPDSGEANTVPVAVITIGSSVVSAYEAIVTSGSTTYTEAVVGSQTLILGSAAVTVDSALLTLASSGIEVGSTTTVQFTTATATTTSTTATGSTTATAAATTSKAGAAMPTHAAGLVLAAGAAAVAAALL